MIRIATETDFPSVCDNELLVRIIGLKRADGLEAPFIRYYSDENGALLSLMDDCGVLYTPQSPSDEWIAFLSMNPDIRYLHCSAECGLILMDKSEWDGKVGEVLDFRGHIPATSPDVCESPDLLSVHELLSHNFDGMSSLNAWYPDVSHRIRHNCSRIACVLDNNKVVSTAITVSETEDACVLGQIATDPHHRRKGLAAKCIQSLIYRCNGKRLYILPMNENARNLYIKLGFAPCGGWAELKKRGGTVFYE